MNGAIASPLLGNIDREPYLPGRALSVMEIATSSDINMTAAIRAKIRLVDDGPIAGCRQACIPRMRRGGLVQGPTT